MQEEGFPCGRCGTASHNDCEHRKGIPRARPGNHKPGEGQTKHGETGLGGLFSTPGAGASFRSRKRRKNQ